jgi:hypothetical protein
MKRRLNCAVGGRQKAEGRRQKAEVEDLNYYLFDALILDGRKQEPKRNAKSAYLCIASS